MTHPVRLRLSRSKGFNLQAVSMATNGLPAVNVARPSKWGNPYKVGEFGSAKECVDAYAHSIGVAGGVIPYDDLHELHGKNLACWCDAEAPCHVDVLLELANPEGA